VVRFLVKGRFEDQVGNEEKRTKSQTLGRSNRKLLYYGSKARSKGEQKTQGGTGGRLSSLIVMKGEPVSLRPSFNPQKGEWMYRPLWRYKGMTEGRVGGKKRRTQEGDTL